MRHGDPVEVVRRRVNRSALVAHSLGARPLPILRGAAAALTADVREELQSLRLPTLLVWGSRDPLVPAELADEWRKGLPRAELAVVEGASHVPMFDRPKELADVLLRFLQEVENERASEALRPRGG